MSGPLQEFGHRESAYEHPDRTWVCGRACEGEPCHVGPDSRGNCGASQECLPHPQGDGFRCGRPRQWGGPCETGPLPDGTCSHPTPPCQPRRSLMSRRRIATFVTAAAALGVCLLMFGRSETSPAMVSPGPVAVRHQLLEQKCSACHVAADGMQVSAELGLAATGTAHDDSGRCLECHDLGAHARSPHSVSPDVLAAATRKASERPASDEPWALALAKLGPQPPGAAEGSLECRVCHHEHRGRDADLTSTSDMQCQVCHTNAFHGLDDGHPDFGDYPHDRRSRIYFDHARHIEHYFHDFEHTMPGGRAPTDCVSCHELDVAGRTMTTRGFERTCASCHEREIEDRRFPGIPFLALPHVEPRRLAEHDVDVGQWPAAPTSGRPFRRLPPFLEALLAADPDYRRAVETLGDVDLRELHATAAEHPEAVERYLWSVKRLFAAVARRGEPELAERLQGTPFAAALPLRPSLVNSLRAARRQWFPNLPAELQARNVAAPDADSENEEESDSTAGGDESAPPAAAPDAPEIAGSGWRVRQRDLSIRYRPRGHADPFLVGWLDATARFAAHDGTDDQPARAAAARLFRILSDPVADGVGTDVAPVASGRCTMCHTIDQHDGGVTVNWKGAPPEKANQGFTRFSHRPHVTAVVGSNCDQCHQMTATGAAPADHFHDAFFRRDPASREWRVQLDSDVHRTSGLLPVERSTCATCHTEEGAKNNCLQCHGYHAAGVRPTPHAFAGE